MAMNRVVLAYSGVHQIFQLALAAEELGELEALHCSMIDRPGKWGAVMASRLPVPSARPFGYESLPADKIVEHPWPVLLQRGLQRLLPWRRSDHRHSNAWFDRVVAARLRTSQARLFVGAETCALHSMRAARARGMRCVLDCAGIDHRFLERQLRGAAVRHGLPPPSPLVSPAMARRKQAELELADGILCCSDFQADVLVSAGVARERIRVVPLWVDAAFWQAGPPRRPRPSGPLRVIYAGGVSLAKGVPDLLEAVRVLGEAVELTLVGRAAPEMAGLLAALPPNIRHRGYVPRETLRQLYAEHDLLVLPSLGDSFGFVAIEAMAAGLPVAVSSHAGVPLPEPAWRVPAGSAAALAARLRHYVQDREGLAEDGRRAAAFAAAWTPERYRRQVRGLLTELLA